MRPSASLVRLAATAAVVVMSACGQSEAPQDRAERQEPASTPAVAPTAALAPAPAPAPAPVA
ncbi:MAG: hypothetical protein J0M02_11160, partial [Planctomycetes bacterium]|nr:hypothetical protein [Planctomycetota bacterium]